jgi:hypothetical protein
MLGSCTEVEAMTYGCESLSPLFLAVFCKFFTKRLEFFFSRSQPEFPHSLTFRKNNRKNSVTFAILECFDKMLALFA